MKIIPDSIWNYDFRQVPLHTKVILLGEDKKEYIRRFDEKPEQYKLLNMYRSNFDKAQGIVNIIAWRYENNA